MSAPRRYAALGVIALTLALAYAIWTVIWEASNLRGLAAAAGADPSNTLRLLQRLVAAGLCEQTPGPRYRVHPDHPFLPQLRSLFAGAAPRGGGNAQARLDELKRETGRQLLQRFSMAQIREKSLENLKRWRAKGAWSPAYQEWDGLLRHANDAILRHVMTSPDEDSNRLRQSMPYVGLLARSQVRALNEKVAP